MALYRYNKIYRLEHCFLLTGSQNRAYCLAHVFYSFPFSTPFVDTFSFQIWLENPMITPEGSPHPQFEKSLANNFKFFTNELNTLNIIENLVIISLQKFFIRTCYQVAWRLLLCIAQSVRCFFWVFYVSSRYSTSAVSVVCKSFCNTIVISLQDKINFMRVAISARTDFYYSLVLVASIIILDCSNFATAKT